MFGRGSNRLCCAPQRLCLWMVLKRTGRVRSSCAYAYAYVMGVLTCLSTAYAYACAYALVKTRPYGAWMHYNSDTLLR